MSTSARPTLINRFLGHVERAGNALPHPATLFVALAGLVVLVSWLCHSLGVTVTNPANGKVVAAVNLLSVEGMQRMILEATRNFLAYPPLGVSLACLRDFARAHGVTAQQTTAEVVAYVREQTSASRRSFAEQRAEPLNGARAASDGAPAVGRATVFVSHAQACRFLKLLDALDAHLTVHKLPHVGTYFW